MWVRAGTLNIGPDSSSPCSGVQTLTFWGDGTDSFYSTIDSIPTGSKNLVITGTVNMNGVVKSSAATSRLQDILLAGATSTTLATGLDFVAGDKIVIAPTNMRTMDTDILEIATYDSSTGATTFTTATTGYHYGASSDTTTDYGVDMRAEVALLTRSIVI